MIGRNLLALNARTTLLIWSEVEIGSTIPHQVLGWKRSIQSALGGNTIGEIQHPHQVKDLMKEGTEPIDKDLGHLPVNLSPHSRI